MATFKRLLDIKKLRERSAESAAREARRALAAREREKVEAEEAVVAFREERLRKEKAMFDKLRGKPVRVDAIEDMKQRVALLRDEERALEQAVETAQKAIVAAREAVTAADRAQAEAARAVSKFEEFVAIQDEEERKALVAKEDAEVEEISEAIFAIKSKGVA